MNNFKLAVSAFSLERWKKWRSDEGVDGFVGWFGIGRDGFADGGPHAASASRTDCDVGVGVLRSENEEWVDGFVIKVKDVLSAG